MPSPEPSIGLMSDTDDIAQQFPALATRPDDVYLDSASTTQIPRVVMKAVTDYVNGEYANPEKNGHLRAHASYLKVEEVRNKAAQFVGATNKGRTVFTTGATEASNMIAANWARHVLADGDEVVLCEQDHSSTVAPWYELQKSLAAEGTQIIIKRYSLNTAGTYSVDSLQACMSDRTRVVVATLVHHTSGMRTGVEAIKDFLPQRAMLCIDATQAAGHIAFDVGELGADTVYFSGHKMFSLPGIGVLWMSDIIYGQMSSHKAGGRQARANKLEAGSVNMPAIISLGAAVDFLDSYGMRNIEAAVAELTDELVEQLQLLHNVELGPGPGSCSCKRIGTGIVTFYVTGKMNEQEIGQILSDSGIYVRFGVHCSFVADRPTLRASVHIYNSRRDIKRLCAVLASLT